MPALSKRAISMLLLGGLSLLLLVAAPLASRAGWLHFTWGLLGMVAATLLSLVVVAVGLWHLRPGADRDRRRGLGIAALLALPALMVASWVVPRGTEAPPIHHISTDLQDPPAFVAAVERRGEHSNPLQWRSETAEIQSRHYPDLAPIQTPLPPRKAFEQARASARELGWEIYASAPEQGRLEAVDTTFWFGFKDDVVIRVRSADNGSVIDLRSVSRVGKGDLGANAERIRAFREHFLAATSDPN